MGREIERKFLVRGNAWRALGEEVLYRQGYLSSDPRRTVRVRAAGGRAWLTIKGAQAGLARAEYEYEIPPSDAEAILDTLAQRPLIEKKRRRIEADGLVWEVDEFLGENAGLVVAEVELADEDQPFIKPDWVGEEVSRDLRYANANLVGHPFSKW